MKMLYILPKLTLTPTHIQATYKNLPPSVECWCVANLTDAQTQLTFSCLQF